MKTTPASEKLTPFTTFLLLMSVSIPVFMIILDTNVVGVSLDAISHTIHATFSDLEWIVNAYTLRFASLLLTTGTLADHYGRKRMLLVGLIIFSATTTLRFIGIVVGIAAFGALLAHQRRDA